MFKACMHFYWSIYCFQILCHCDLSVNCPFFAFLTLFEIFIDLKSQWNCFKSRKMENIQSRHAFKLKYSMFSIFVSLWHISKWSIVCIFWHFLQYLLVYSHNETPFYHGKWKIFKDWMHFDWNIDTFQFSCHCDISLNCPFYTFFDTFCNIYLLTITMQLLFIKENKKYSKLGCILTEILTVFKFRVIVTYQ